MRPPRLGLILSALLCGVLSACGGPPIKPAIVLVSGPQQPADQTLYMVRRGWHTDIGLPVRQLQGRLAAVAAGFPGAAVLLFGFGDRRYLLAHARGSADVAALWPGSGLMLVTGLEAPPQQAFGTDAVAELHLTQQQAAAVADFVNRALQADADGALRRQAAGPYPGSVFYAASADYSAWHTCNTWTAEALQAGGEPVSHLGVVFAWQLWPQVQQLQARP